ncbi:DNA oxidative demethylase AlkB [Dongia soli]|uniref:DNA oxidative demethylase AlkB n=1 Tax=Dongia soli TaxID=600628 RepID=A0ABU5E8P8_9PROT|nr:DNA oxidative demethylase AlkB [Dongia soli]MDY0882536.1 DNA oxidative demethylase AlkB [Dongia soli]
MGTGDLFAEFDQGIMPLAEGGVILRGFALDEVTGLFADILDIASRSPFRHMTTPGGYRMSVAITNCGDYGWITDRRGYRYEAIDPATSKSWPAMPSSFLALAQRAADMAGFPDFWPTCCLVNRYEPGAKLSLHQDKDEADFAAPIVSVSLGLPATFLFGGARRNDKARRFPLNSGDVAVWGGASRLHFHGVDTLAGGTDSLTGPYRFNLTFRKVR